MLFVCNYLLSKWQEKGLVQDNHGHIAVTAITGPGIFSDAIKRYINEPITLSAVKIVKKYFSNNKYRKYINRLGIYFTSKDFFHGVATQNLYWGSSESLGSIYNSWSKEARDCPTCRD